MSWWRADIKIDRWIERMIKNHFIPTSQSVIDDAITQVRKIRPDLPADDPHPQILTKEIHRSINLSVVHKVIHAGIKEKFFI